MLFTGDLENIPEAQEFSRPGAGVYCCQVAKTEIVPQKEYVKVYLDFAMGEFKGRGKAIEESKNGADWGYIKSYLSYKTTALGFLKRNLGIFAESNKLDRGKLVHEFNQSDGACLAGKYVGIVVGEVEYKGNDGKIKRRLGLPQLVTVQEAKNNPEKFKVPELEKYVEERGTFGLTVDDTDIPF